MTDSGLPHLVQGLYRYSGRDDLPPVRFVIRLEEDRYIARIWTDDLRRNMYARSKGSASWAVFREFHGMVDELAHIWLREDASKCPAK